MVELNRRWAPDRSQDNCMTSPSLTLPLYIPFLFVSLSTLLLSSYMESVTPNPITLLPLDTSIMLQLNCFLALHWLKTTLALF